MPELPEVETTRRGIASYVVDNRITNVIIRNRRLRWPVATILERVLRNETFRRLERRAKYLLFQTDHGCMILHLGMSGSLRIVSINNNPGIHDHIDILFNTGHCLRFHDPRRFGSIHWTSKDPLHHPLLRRLGPEPLGDDLHGDYLYIRSRNRTLAVKQFIMNSRIVAGIGNIYANEALFLAGIHPRRQAGRIARQRYHKLAVAIKNVLQQALDCGGTTLRDFADAEGKPGYFRQKLQVYDRGGEPCHSCGDAIRQSHQGQRATYYCPVCQI